MFLGVFAENNKRIIRLPFAGLVLIGIFLASRILSNQQSSVSLPSKLQDFITLSASVVIEALPFVLLGIALSVIVQVWLPENLLFKLLPKRAFLRRFVLSFFGIFLPVCECGNIPLARGLMLKGLSLGDSLTFLLAAPILNPVTIITTQQAFGGDSTILIARLAGGFLIANVVGWLFSKHHNPEQLLTDSFAASCKHAHTETKLPGERIKNSLQLFKNEAGVIMPALFVGSFIAGFVQVAIPRSVLTDIGGHVVWSIVAMMVLAFIVSICANVDAFFALAFANTFTTGAIVSFLVFGPIVDIKMLTLMRTTYKVRVIATITLVTVLISATLGLAVNYAF